MYIVLYRHMPHTNPTLHIATTEIPATNESMFSNLISRISRGIGSATGTRTTPAPPVEVETLQAVPVHGSPPVFGSCYPPTVAALQKCLDTELSDCEQTVDDLIRCLNESRPIGDPKNTPFFTR